MIGTLLEITRDCKVCMRPDVYSTLRNRILTNIDLRIADGTLKETEQQALVHFRAGAQVGPPANTVVFMGNAQYIKYYEDVEDDDQIINIVRLTGPMTRGGGSCSYGSKDHRDMLMRAADIKQTVGHIIYCATPGGMVSTMRDYRMAINYCHSKGQKVYMYCDGDVASGGAFTAGICDEVWAANPEDEIGSLGMYSAFFTLADGEKNAITGETYHEYYADASPDKNKWYRKASKGDMSVVEEETKRDLAQLLANFKKDRPQAKSEQLTGDMYKMKDVVGSLIDGFCSMSELAQKILDDHTARKGAALPPKEAAAPVDFKPQTKTNQTSNKENMSKTYTQVGAFIGEGPLESDKEGCVTLQPEQADAMEEKLGTIESEKQTLADEITSLKQEKETLTTQVSGLEAEKETLTSDKTALESRVQELEAELETANTEKQQLTTDMQAKDQTITDLQTTVEELNTGAGKKPDAGASPENNGMSGAQPTLKVGYVYDPALSPSENRKRREAHLKEMKSLGYKQ